MKKPIKLLFIFLILGVVLAAPLFPLPVKAAAPSITGISPTSIVNDVDQTITITGTGFETNAEVKVGSTAVYVTLFEPDRLIVRIDAGFPPGLYSIMVTNPSSPDAPVSFSSLAVTAAPTPTITPSPTLTPTPVPFGRPQIVIDAYHVSVDYVQYGQDFKVSMSLDNAGGSTAHDLQITFTSADLLMLKNGGVIAAGDLGVVGKANFSQTMTAAASLAGVLRVSFEMDVSYTDDKGTAYTDKFPISLPVAQSSSSGGGGTYHTTTPTPTGGPRRSQLVVVNYATDAQPLQPGDLFTLSMDVKNEGTISAKSITMIIGGGSASGSDNGTPSAGVSAGSGEFTNFAPVGSSNVQSLGDLAAGLTLTAKQSLIVNVSTAPGAYPMKVTFSYLDDKGNAVNDEQVITLLVYSLPVVDVSFYQPVSSLMAGQSNTLPFQVVNLGKKNYVLGKMKVETTGGMLENAEGLVGSLDPGGYFTLDSTVTPDAAGTLELTITIDYTDDFNQPRTITKTMSVEVMDAGFQPTPEPGTSGDGSVIPPSSDTFWQKIWRFILGLFGLDSGNSSGTQPGGSTGPVVPTSLPVFIGPGGKG